MVNPSRCGVCLRPGDTFPGGFYTEAMCEHCIAAHGITPLQHCPFGLQLQEALGASYGLLPTSPDRTIDTPEPLMAPFTQLVVVVTIQLDTGHAGALYPCWLHGS